jgi:hypothetical protein
MKTRFAVTFLLFASLLLTVSGALAETKGATQPLPELAIVVVDTVHRNQGAIGDFDRIDIAFQRVAKQRKWPVKIAAERFAANTAAHDPELRIFDQPLREETLDDLTFRGWMTLSVNGTKHDFGIVTFRYYRRAGEQLEDALEKVFRGAANVAADKIEPILFPKTAGPKS